RRDRQLVGEVGGHLDEPAEDVDHRTPESVHLRRVDDLLASHLDPRHQIRLGPDPVQQADPFDPLDHQAHAAVRHPSELVDHADGAHPMEVRGRGRLHLRISLRDWTRSGSTGAGNGSTTSNGPWRMPAEWYVAPSSHEGSWRRPSTSTTSSKSWTSKSSSSTPARSTTISIVVAVSYVSASGRQRVCTSRRRRSVCQMSPNGHGWSEGTTTAYR